MNSREASVEGTWQYDVTQQMANDGPRFRANIHSSISGGAIGLCAAVAALFAAVPIWVGVLGLVIAVWAAAGVEARIRYGTGRLIDMARVFRSWLRLSP